MAEPCQQPDLAPELVLVGLGEEPLYRDARPFVLPEKNL